MTRPKTKSQVKVNSLTFGMMVQYFIEHGDATVAELHDHTGLHPNTIREWLHVWRKLKLVHIGGWDRDVRGRPTIYRLKWGKGRDAKRPSLTIKEIKRNYMRRKRAIQLATVFAQPIPGEATDDSAQDQPRQHRAQPGRRVLDEALRIPALETEPT